MEQETILDGYSDAEKGAYLSAIASLATADRQASEEELDYLRALATAANLPQSQLQSVEQAATDTSGQNLNQNLDVLKNSELRFSLVADLISFAKADQNYSEAEQQSVQRISEYLGVNSQQFGLLNEFAQNTAAQNVQDPQAAQSMLGIGGLGSKMQSAGINTGGLLKGLLGLAAPMILGKMMGGRGGAIGGLLGGVLAGGLGGMFGGGGNAGGIPSGQQSGGGGLGSLIGMLNGGRGMGSTGGLLGKVLGGFR